jgi:hypothetical protein
MDSYIRYKGARCRIFVYSRSENPETWEERPSKKIINKYLDMPYSWLFVKQAE